MKLNCVLRLNHCVKKLPVSKKRWKSSTPRFAAVEEKLGDSELYDQSCKSGADPTVCKTQAKTKSSLEECEMAWLGCPEQLEAMLQAD